MPLILLAFGAACALRAPSAAVLRPSACAAGAAAASNGPVCCYPATASGEQPRHRGPNRRTLLALGAAALGLPRAAWSADSVLEYKNFNLYGEGSDERCEAGQGAACERLAGDSELVRRLQEQSRANREKNARAIYDQTVRGLNYAEYFDSRDKNLVQKPDGKFLALDIETYTRLRKEGKIKVGSIDQLVDADADGTPAAGAPPPAAGAGAGAGAAQLVEYRRFVEAVKAPGVEGAAAGGSALQGPRLAPGRVRWRPLPAPPRNASPARPAPRAATVAARRLMRPAAGRKPGGTARPGVIFEAPRGDFAVVLFGGGDAMLRAEVKASWKRTELKNVLARLDVPTNLADLPAP